MSAKKKNRGRKKKNDFIFTSSVVPVRNPETGEVAGWARYSALDFSPGENTVVYLRNGIEMLTKDFNFGDHCGYLYESEDEAMRDGYQKAKRAMAEGNVTPVIPNDPPA